MTMVMTGCDDDDDDDDDDKFFINDPFIQCDLENAGYLQMGNGSGKYYSFEHWLPRSRLGGGVGWALTCRSLA